MANNEAKNNIRDMGGFFAVINPICLNCLHVWRQRGLANWRATNPDGMANCKLLDSCS